MHARIARLAPLAALLLLLVQGGQRALAARLVDGGSTAALRADADAGTAPQPPKLPESYSVNYTFTLPYTAAIQQSAIRYPVAFYRDGQSKQVRMDTYDSTNVLIAKKGRTYELVPRIDRQVCLVFDAGGDESLQGMASLPDVQGWVYSGVQELEGQEAHMWTYEARHEGKHVVYRYYVAADGTPRRFHMHGNDLFSGAHFDEWVVDYTGFRPGRPHPSVFDTPELCRNEKPRQPTATAAAAAPGGPRTASQMRMVALVPAVRYRGGDDKYDAFLASHGAGRAHASLQEYQERRTLFAANLRLIEEHNAANRSYQMAVNMFADFTDDEFLALLLPKKLCRRQQLASLGAAAAVQQQQQEEQAWKHRRLGRHELPYEPLTDPARLPRSVSWRGTGADSIGVKDQANCGSCWSFAAAGAMEGAWWRATGQTVSFSEQQIIDCSWGFVPGSEESNMACDGGDPWAAIGHIVEAGGIAVTADYQYKGQDGYCLAHQTRRLGKFKGYARIPRYDDSALMEALYSRGPIAISFDASRPGFRFYSSGVYMEAECGYKPADLDHSMLLVGYGRGPAGDYWEVKNSWSTHWGEGGYFKVTRDHHGCGMASDAQYAIAADSV